MSKYEHYFTKYNTRWQRRIVKINFVAAAVVLIFEIAYFFFLSAIGLRDQTPLEYILRYILLPACIIFVLCAIGWFIVYRSHRSSDIKFLAAWICGAKANIFSLIA